MNPETAVHVDKKARVDVTGSHGELVMYDKDQMTLRLDKLYRTREGTAHMDKVLPYNFHQSRCYPKNWYESKPFLAKFTDIVAYHGWTELLGFTHVIYPVKLVQFWGSAVVDEDKIH